METDSSPNQESYIERYRVPLILCVFGFLLIGSGIFLYKGYSLGSSKVEIIEGDEENKEDLGLTVEISGAVEKAGVYTFAEGSRVEDLLIASGGIAVDADRVWMDKYLNRATKLKDGQKVYIPREGEQSDTLSANNEGGIRVDQGSSGGSSEKRVNINTAGMSELESLPGIGPAYGQSIIEHRPYSNIEELVSKGALHQNVFKKVQELVSVY